MTSYNYTNNGERSSAQEFERSGWISRINTVANSLTRAHKALYSPTSQNLTRNVAAVSYNALAPTPSAAVEPEIQKQLPVNKPAINTPAIAESPKQADSHEFALYDDETSARLATARVDIGEIYGDTGASNG